MGIELHPLLLSGSQSVELLGIITKNCTFSKWVHLIYKICGNTRRDPDFSSGEEPLLYENYFDLKAKTPYQTKRLEFNVCVVDLSGMDKTEVYISLTRAIKKTLYS
jgi:hypothetical protein